MTARLRSTIIVTNDRCQINNHRAALAGGFESPKLVGAIAFKDPSVDEASGSIDADWQPPAVESDSFWDDVLGHAAIIFPAVIGGLLVIYVLLRWCSPCRAWMNPCALPMQWRP